MHIHKQTPFHVASGEIVSQTTLGGLIDMVKGGLDLSTVTVCTTDEEAQKALAANRRRALVGEFSNHAILSSAQLALLDEEGKLIDRVEFCPTDH